MILAARTFRSAARVCGVLFLASGLLPGAVIFDNFASDPPGYDLGGYLVWSMIDPSALPPLQAGGHIAMRFMATQDAAVEVAQLPLRFDQYSSTALRVSLTEATRMGTPGAVMDSFSLTSDPAAMALYSGMFSLRPALTAGKQYWLTVTTESNFASVVWGGTHSFFPRDPSHPVGAIAQRSLSPTIPP